MPDDLLSDVKELLEKEIGDKKVLEQIKRAAENNEAISNYERNYVAKLIRDIRKPPEPKVEPTIETQGLVQKEQVTTITPQTPIPIVKTKHRDKTNTKVVIGAGVIALAIIVAVVIGISGLDIKPSSILPTTKPVLLDVDQSSYNKGDVISISGKSKTSLGKSISLSIENANNELIWAEDVKIKDNGEYSTLAIAGGPGWEQSGTYTLKMRHGSEDHQITFSFKN
jgi:hypothetical protein